MIYYFLRLELKARSNGDLFFLWKNLSNELNHF